MINTLSTILDSQKHALLYRYRAFGLNIESEVFLPELEAGEGIPDARIVLGETPGEIPEAVVKRERYQSAPGKFLLKVPQVGAYCVTGGEQIIVEPDPSAEAAEVRLFLLGTALGVLLMQRSVLPIHGSALAFGKQGVIFTGLSGAGKSTLLSAFRKRGVTFLTDDITGVTTDEQGMPWIQSGYPQQKLWRDSMECMGLDVTGCSKIMSKLDKFAIAANKEFCRTPARLAVICELRMENRPGVALIRLAGPDKLAVLLRHTYRQSLLAGLGLKEDNFTRCAEVAKQIAVYRMLRPAEGFTVAEQTRFVEEMMTELVVG
jgi:hypothetical protein